MTHDKDDRLASRQAKREERKRKIEERKQARLDRKKNIKAEKNREKQTIVHSKSIKRKHRIIESLKICEMRPSQVLADIHSQIKKYPKGLVQKFDKGYRLIAIDDTELARINFTKKSEWFGEFSNMLTKSIVLSATLLADATAGYLVLIPNKSTLENLNSIPEFHKAEFNWAFFPFEVSDDDLEAKSIISNEKVTLVQLINMQEEDNSLVEQSKNTSELSSNDDSNDEKNNSNDEGKTSSSENSDSLIETSDPPDNSSSENSDDKVPSAPQNDDDLLLDNSITPDNINTSRSTDAIIAETDSKIKNVSSSNPENPELLESDWEQVIDSIENNFINGTKTDIETKINLEPLKSLLKLDDVPQFELIHTDSTASLDALQNRSKIIFNSQLKKLHEQHRQEIISFTLKQINDAREKIDASLSESNSESQYYNKRQNIDNKNNAANKDIAKKIDIETKKRNEEYQNQKEKFIDLKSQEAALEFDNLHKKELQNELVAYKNSLKVEINETYANDLYSLKQQRQTDANKLISQMTDAILASVRKIDNNFSKDEQELFQKYQVELDKQSKENYSNEVLRTQTISNKLRHDKTIKLLKSQLNSVKEQASKQRLELEQKNRSEIKKLKRSSTKSLQEQQKSFNLEKEKLLASNSQLADTIKTIKSNVAKDYEDRIKGWQDRANLFEAKANNATNKTAKNCLITGFSVFVVMATAIIGLVFYTSSQDNSANRNQVEKVFVTSMNPSKTTSSKQKNSVPGNKVKLVKKGSHSHFKYLIIPKIHNYLPKQSLSAFTASNKQINLTVKSLSKDKVLFADNNQNVYELDK